jgi:hypothetical protein
MELWNMLTDLDDIRRSIERALPPDVMTALRDERIALALTPSSDLGPIVTISDELAERELAGEMVTYRKKKTGVDNTIFISQQGYAPHAARIKIAIDPPDSINVRSKTVSVAVDSGKVVAGDKAKISAALQKQVQKFVVLNREVLLKYWDASIDTDELAEQLKPIESEK